MELSEGGVTEENEQHNFYNGNDWNSGFCYFRSPCGKGKENGSFWRGDAWMYHGSWRWDGSRFNFGTNASPYVLETHLYGSGFCDKYPLLCI